MSEILSSNPKGCPHGHEAKYLCIACAYEHAKQLRAALQSFVDFQIGDYYRQAEAAKRYCEIRREAVAILGGRAAPETNERAKLCHGKAHVPITTCATCGCFIGSVTDLPGATLKASGRYLVPPMRSQEDCPHAATERGRCEDCGAEVNGSDSSVGKSE